MTAPTTSVRDLLDTHAAAGWPPSLAPDAEVDGIALVLLDADVTALAAAWLDADGVLRPDQWLTLRAAADDARAVLPHVSGEAWVHVGRLYALARAMLRTAPDAG